MLQLACCAVLCRYSGFLALYPIGVSSELTMAWLALPYIKETGAISWGAGGGLFVP